MTSRLPGPKGPFLLGSIKPFSQDLLKFLSATKTQYGDFVHFKLGTVNTYLVSRPDLIRHVLVTDQEKFIKNRFFWKHFTSIFGKGLLTNEGLSWRVHRKLSAPAFQPKGIANYADFMVQLTEKMISEWPQNSDIELQDEMMLVTAKIVAKALFDVDLNVHVDELLESVRMLEEQIPVRMARPFTWLNLLPTKNNRQYWKALKQFNGLVKDFIQQHKNRATSGDESSSLLSVLMKARYEDGSPLSDKQLRDEVITLFLAGHDTTAITLTWAFYLLSSHPDKREKLEQEIDEVLSSRNPTWDDLKTLRYTRSVIKETLRLYPAAHLIGREAAEDVDLDGISIKKGCSILISPWLMGRDASYFEDPLAFKPERWTEQFEKELPKGVYVPFGAGPRVCIGEGFAMMEAVILLSTIVKEFRLEYLKSEVVKPFPSITLPPEGGIQMRVFKRRKKLIKEGQLEKKMTP